MRGVFVIVTLFAAGCQSTSGVESEYRELEGRAQTIQGKADQADIELVDLAKGVGRWVDRHKVEQEPSRILRSLLTRPTFLHRPTPGKHTVPAATEYGKLEDRAEELKQLRREVESDWGGFLADFDAWQRRHRLELEKRTEEHPFDFGEDFLPDPRDPAKRKKPCALKIKHRGRDCYLVFEECKAVGPEIPPLGWSQLCQYRCVDPQKILAKK